MMFRTKISTFILLLFWVFVATTEFAKAQRNHFGKLKTGDLLFQDLDCGDLCDAIEQVTQSYRGRHFSHIGLVSVEGDSTYIIEAIGTTVHRTPIFDFVNRNNNELLLGRVKRRYRKIATNAVNFALQQLGLPYDDIFLYNNGKYYCSELIYDAFRSANRDKDFFSLAPMTFMQPNSKSFFPVWVDYYQNLSAPIPEGMAGINPGGISLSAKLTMYYYRKAAH